MKLSRLAVYYLLNMTLLIALVYPQTHKKSQVGLASWYGKKFQDHKMYNGERYDMFQLTAAHRTFPLGSLVKVTNIRTGDTCVVRITDRGPWIKGRIIDLSYAAARLLNLHGVEKVKLERID